MPQRPRRLRLRSSRHSGTLTNVRLQVETSAMPVIRQPGMNGLLANKDHQ
jgi:hypothetical protein